MFRASILLLLASAPAFGQSAAQPTVVSVSAQQTRDETALAILRDELAREITAVQADPSASEDVRNRRMGDIQALQREIAMTQQRVAKPSAVHAPAASAARQKPAGVSSALAPDVFSRARREGTKPSSTTEEPRS